MLPPGSPAPPVGDSGPARREAAGTVRGPPPGSKFRNRESTEPSGRRQGRRLPWFGFRLRRGPEAGGSPSRRSEEARLPVLALASDRSRTIPSGSAGVGSGPVRDGRRGGRRGPRGPTLGVGPPPDSGGRSAGARRAPGPETMAGARGFAGGSCRGTAPGALPSRSRSPPSSIPVADRPEGRRPGGAGADCPEACGRDSCSLHAPSGTPTFRWGRMSIRFARPAVSRTPIPVRRPGAALNS